jgi:diguanylate cyclase (GGDEF)-like protein
MRVPPVLPQTSTANGMAASDNPTPQSLPRAATECLSAAALQARVDEEIARATRHGSPLSCLLVSVEDLREIEQIHGKELSQQALAYVGLALQSEFRRFDRVGRPNEIEFLVVLPGADGPRGEIVARRTLERLRAIKLEREDGRRALRVSVGIAAWREQMSATELIDETRQAMTRERLLGFQDAFGV